MDRKENTAESTANRCKSQRNRAAFGRPKQDAVCRISESLTARQIQSLYKSPSGNPVAYLISRCRYRTSLRRVR
jgi:hypothetical protein